MEQVHDQLPARPGDAEARVPSVDARRGIGEVDIGIMDQLDSAAVGYQIVLTKTDKIKPAEVEATVADTLPS